jgi:predicted nuclease with TOPRIM domain
MESKEKVDHSKLEIQRIEKILSGLREEYDLAFQALVDLRKKWSGFKNTQSTIQES